jgi:hypothetical protein
MQSRLERLGGGELCQVCGHGYEPFNPKIVFVGLPPKPDHDPDASDRVEYRDTPPDGPENCPACGRPIRYHIKALGLNDPDRDDLPHLP